MSDRPPSFQLLLERLRCGSPDAPDELMRRYGAHVLRVIRHRLDRRLRKEFDSLDFFQDVWKSFFEGPPPGGRFDSPEALIAYLARVAQHKVIDASRRRLGTQKHDRAREHSLEGSAAWGAAAAGARQPTPSQEAVAHDLWERLLVGLPPEHQQIVMLLREGRSHAEIARELRVDRKTVYNVVRRLSPRLPP
jgi:RNA polymerase sigma factor (sigma-70 family)